MDTFVVQDEDDKHMFSQELPNTAVTGHPYLEHVAPMAIFNPTGSGKTVRIRRIEHLPQMAQNSVTVGTFDLTRITAHTGTGDAIEAESLDSSNVALPSQVVCARRPATITTTGTPLEVRKGNPFANDTRVLGGVFALPALSWIVRRWDATTPELQRITLREGQGIAVTLNDVTGYVWRLMVVVTVRVVSTGACYVYQVPVTPMVLPMLSILNGSGSGVVLEVVNVSFREIGTDVMPQIAVEPIDGIGDGDTLTPVALDSTADIGAVIVRHNCKIRMRGSKYGALISIPHQDWINPGVFGVGPGLSNLTGNAGRFNPAKPYANEFDTVLREGEGIAVTYKNAGSLGRMSHRITFTVDGPVYPLEADVELGIQYGPNGTDYTGTLSAGGGNTYSRSRVVNA